MRRALAIVGTAWAFLGILPASAGAQTLVSELARSSSNEMMTADSAPAQTIAPPPIAVVEPASRSASLRVLVPLYVSAAALQMMDVHSTRRALAVGHSEGNPVMAGIASNTAAFVAVKAATAATTIWVSEKLRKRNRVAAIGLMIAVNAATAAVVAHNYQVAR